MNIFGLFILSICLGYVVALDFSQLNLKPNKTREWDLMRVCPWPFLFTQGIEQLKDKSTLMISTGWYGISKIEAYNYDILKCKFEKLASQPLEEKYFGEGLTLINRDKQAMQLTWKERTVFVWDIETEPNFNLVLNETKKMPKNNRIAQGWGIAKIHGDSNEVIVSDGSSDLKIVNLDEWKHVSKIAVKFQDGTPLRYINELETIPGGFMKDYVFAHAFHSNAVHMVSLKTGDVVKSWEMQELLDHQDEHVQKHKDKYAHMLGEEEVDMINNSFVKNLVWRGQYQNWNNSDEPEDMYKHYAFYDVSNNVLNGIAYMLEHDSFLITGKMWSHIYQIRLNYKPYVTEYMAKLREKAKQKSDL